MILIELLFSQRLTGFINTSSSATLAHISTSLGEVRKKKEENTEKEENGIQENLVACCCCNV